MVSHKITRHVDIIIVVAWFIIQLAKSPVQVRETHYYQVELERRLRPFCEESACICESPLSILRLPPVQRLARFGGLSSIYPAFCPYDCSDSLQPNHDPELTGWMNR